jgi:hypothetical protein
LNTEDVEIETKAKRKKKKNKGKVMVTNEELANYNADDLVNFITGGKRKDAPKKDPSPKKPQLDDVPLPIRDTGGTSAKALVDEADGNTSDPEGDNTLSAFKAKLANEPIQAPKRLRPNINENWLLSIKDQLLRH